MSVALKLTIFLLGVVFVVTVIYLLVRRKISERNSFLWLTGALIILMLSTMPDILIILAQVTGVDYPPTLLFLLSILVVLFILLHQSIQISILQEKCRELAQQLAIANIYVSTGQVESQDNVGNGEVSKRSEVI
jgi:hypothetical protein